MNNDALMAALGMDAVAAVHGYRSEIVADAARRGLRLVSAPLIDPLDIRLTFDGGDRPDLEGRVLRWSPAEGWSSCSQEAVRFYAGPSARPLDLVPTVPDVMDWAVGHGRRGRASRYSGSPPDGVDLDDDPRAIRRLIDFVGPHRRRHAHKASRTPHRHGGHHVAQPLALLLGPAGPVILTAVLILPWFVSAARRTGKG